MTDTDRMQTIGYLPGIDPSAEDRPRTNWTVYRDYDLLHMPAAILDRDGVDAAREVLDKAEYETALYAARAAADDSGESDEAANGRARAEIAGKHLGRALAEIGRATEMLAHLAGDGYPYLAGEKWEAIVAALSAVSRTDLTAVHALRRACAVTDGTTPETAASR